MELLKTEILEAPRERLNFELKHVKDTDSIETKTNYIKRLQSEMKSISEAPLYIKHGRSKRYNANLFERLQLIWGYINLRLLDEAQRDEFAYIVHDVLDGIYLSKKVGKKKCYVHFLEDFETIEMKLKTLFDRVELEERYQGCETNEAEIQQVENEGTLYDYTVDSSIEILQKFIGSIALPYAQRLSTELLNYKLWS